MRRAVRNSKSKVDEGWLLVVLGTSNVGTDYHSARGRRILAPNQIEPMNNLWRLSTRVSTMMERHHLLGGENETVFQKRNKDA